MAGASGAGDTSETTFCVSFKGGPFMNPIFLVAALAAQQSQAGADEAIVVTASREPVAAVETGVSATIFDKPTLDALALPATSDVLRLPPGVSVTTPAQPGTQTQLQRTDARAHRT